MDPNYKWHRAVTIVTLTRFPDIFETFAASVEKHEPAARRIVVTSGGVSIKRHGWEVIEGIEPFVFARNANAGIAAACIDDVLLSNDDVELIEPIIEQLSCAAYEADAALVSPQIVGDGINHQLAQAQRPLPVPWCVTRDYVPFVCVYLRRSPLDALGPLKEFEGYGGEDVEFGLRCIRQGWPLVISKARVKHGHGGHNHSSSFLRVMTNFERNQSAAETMKAAYAK